MCEIEMVGPWGSGSRQLYENEWVMGMNCQRPASGWTSPSGANSALLLIIQVNSNNYSTMTNARFRLSYRQCKELLVKRLAEPAPGRIQILTGPRQVGKTTLLLELAGELGDACIYAAADGPEAAIPGFWERLWARVEEQAATARPTVLLLDEIPHVDKWGIRLKGQWDRIRRRKIQAHVVVTGSSALKLNEGSRDSLGGRFERIILAHWSAGALAEAFRIEPLAAADTVVTFGSYPGAHQLIGDPVRWGAYVRDAIIEPAIGRDVLALGKVRRPALLRQVFALSAMMPATIIPLQKLQGQLQDKGAIETIAHYLGLLEDAYLVAPCEKYSEKPIRQRKSPPKIVVLSNALVAAMSTDGILSPSREPSRYGRWVENACLAHAWNMGQRVMYWREEPREVDAVLQGSWGAWAVEVKTGAFHPSDLGNLYEFCRRYPQFRPLALLGEAGDVDRAREAGAKAMTWREFLLSGGPGD